MSVIDFEFDFEITYRFLNRFIFVLSSRLCESIHLCYAWHQRDIRGFNYLVIVLGMKRINGRLIRTDLNAPPYSSMIVTKFLAKH